MQKILSDLANDDVIVELNKDLSKYSTMRLKAYADLLTIKSIPALQDVIKQLNKKNVEYRVLGWGANQILHTNPSFIYLKLDLPKIDSLDNLQDEYELSASTSLNMLTAAAVKFNLSGWEVFTGVPASFGGAIFMNAGTRLGEIGDLIKSIKVLRFSGEIVNIQKDKESFSYRKNNFAGVGDVILSAVIKHNGVDESISQKIKDYMVHRKSTQPIASKTCGCVFKNYSPELPAGKAIDVLGLRGMSYKGIEISDKHCNFFENKKEAKVESFLELSSFVTEQLERYYGVEFELEVKI